MYFKVISSIALQSLHIIDGGLGLLSPIDPIFYLLYFISLIITKENLSNDPCAIPFIPWNQHLLNALEKLSPSPLQKTAILNIFSMNDSINHNWIDTRLEKLCNTKQGIISFCRIIF